MIAGDPVAVNTRAVASRGSEGQISGEVTMNAFGRILLRTAILLSLPGLAFIVATLWDAVGSSDKWFWIGMSSVLPAIPLALLFVLWPLCRARR